MAANDISTRSGYYVYALFRENGVPFYVGKGKGQRWTAHERSARSGIWGHKAAIIRSMQARGLEVIKIKLHEGLIEAIAYEYEVALIEAIGRYPIGPLVNLTTGGDGSPGLRGRKRSQETRAKMADAARGRRMSPESVAKTAAANRGRKLSEAHRAKTSATLLGRKKSPEAIAKSVAARRGRKRTAESRAKMALAKIGRKQSPEHVAKIIAAKLTNRIARRTSSI